MPHPKFDIDDYLAKKAERIADNQIKYARLAKAVRQAPDLVKLGRQDRDLVDLIEDEDEDEEEES